MQPGITHTRDSLLLDAADQVTRDADVVASILRESRLELSARNELERGSSPIRSW